MANLATKYRPKDWDDVVEQSDVVTMLRSICESPLTGNRNFLLIGPAGCGKAQPLYSKVLTPSGFINMRDVKVGTTVITHTGKWAAVSGVYPQGLRPVYTICLADGRQIDVSDEHLNLLDLHSGEHRIRCVLTTTELISCIKDGLRFSIPDPHIDADDLSSYFDLGDWYQYYQAIRENTITNPGSNNIVSITQTAKYECQCIYVDHEDHTYITDNFVSTHNTTLGRLMANKLNGGLGDPIEIDAASHNGVDSVREIVQQARAYPVGCNYKVFICDECFPGHYRVQKKGSSELVKLSEVSEGDYVRGINGFSKVTAVRKNTVPIEHLVCIHTDRRDIITTKHHLIFTDSGWIPAIDLIDGDVLQSANTDYDSLSDRCCYEHVSSLLSCMIRIPRQYIQEDENDVCFISFYPSMYKFTDTDRGGLQFPNVELGLIAYNNDHESDPEIVKSVDVYSDEIATDIFSSVLTSDNMSSRTATLYDLTLLDHPSYYVENILVHNCHAFSNQAWQVLLKTLEEGPAKSCFVFCTTDPEKIPATIISRVQTFQISKISLKGIESRIKHVIELENNEGRNISYEDDAINYIAKLANGGMRDSLTLLDKALTYSNNITSKSLEKSLGLPNYDDYFSLLSAYAKRDNESIARIIHEVYNSGINFSKWFQAFHGFVMNVVKYIFMQDISATMIPSYYSDKISKYGSAHSIICLKLANKLIELNHELKTTQYLQEVALTYLCSVPKKG